MIRRLWGLGLRLFMRGECGVGRERGSSWWEGDVMLTTTSLAPPPTRLQTDSRNRGNGQRTRRAREEDCRGV